MSNPQAETYTLFCILEGDKSPFPIKIANNEAVGVLKEAIKDRNPNALANIDAKELALYRVDAGGPNLREKVNAANTKMQDLNPDDALDPTEPLSTIFCSAPSSGKIHILVQLPPGAGSNRKRKLSPSTSQTIVSKRFHVAEDSAARVPPPSSLGKEKFARKLRPSRFDLHRPPNSGAIPLSLLHPIFAKFTENMERLEPTPEDNALASELRQDMSVLYENEAVQCEKFREIIAKHYRIQLNPSQVRATRRTTDGHVKHIIQPYILAICEGKVWDGDGDPEMQASGYVLEALRPKLLEGKDPLDLLPCIVIYFVGALICFSGTVLTDRLQLETFTGFPLHINIHRDVKAKHIARAFGAFRIAVGELHKHYDDMPAPQNDLSALQASEKAARLKFPFPDSYTVEGEEIKFTYNSRFDNRRLMFIATTNDGIKVLIKFTERYSSDAHLFCANANMAPTLYGFEQLLGGWYMVVMEYLDPQIYRVLEPSSDNNTGMIGEIKRIVRALHEGGYVHGDIRDVNMMTRRKWESTAGAKNVVLLDFDWAGLEGTVTYPANVNRTSIKRHLDAEDGRLIKKDHDVFMVDRIFK